MRRITFAIHSVGSSEERYTRNIMIGKPTMSIIFCFNEEDLEQYSINRVSQLINEVKTVNRCVNEMLNEWGMEKFKLETTYIKQGDYLLAFELDKPLDDVFSDFQTNHLKLVHFYVPSGASFECNGYRFMVHSDERVHMHMPHVHVIKGGESVRYSLDTLERIDKCSPQFLQDEKKKIRPALKKHLSRLQRYWIAAMNGYRPPQFDFNNKQYYPES